jgi:hypothetical protein
MLALFFRSLTALPSLLRESEVSAARPRRCRIISFLSDARLGVV